MARLTARCVRNLLGAVLWFGIPAGAPHADDGLARRIDQEVEAACADAGTKPSPVVDDATFLRRVSLDLIGRVPTVAEVRAFLESPEPDRRARLVDSLLTDSSHARQMASFWRRTWIPQADSDSMGHMANDLEDWLARQFSQGQRLDSVVRDLLTASEVPIIGGSATRTPVGFLLANELKPELLAGSTARSFLGLNLACAQCHDHPFASWSRDQFWELAAFFARPSPNEPSSGQPRIEVAGASRTVRARPPDGSQLSWPTSFRPETSRRVLGEWVTRRSNPWFARHAVNQLWTHFFGEGLVADFDDPASEEINAHRRLLDDLAQAFSSSGFDVAGLTRSIVLSRSYQRQAIAIGSPAARTFGCARIRTLTGEQLYESIRAAAGLRLPRDEETRATDLRERRRFVSGFQMDRPASDTRTVLQSLTVMNGTATLQASDGNHTPTLVALATPFFSTRDQVETLFLATLSRVPRESELRPIVSYVERGGADHEVAKALADVFWALLNTSEFNTNH
ncbi:MAG: DUF1549 domain-containing protein [Isosphaeraceae bacterium]